MPSALALSGNIDPTGLASLPLALLTFASVVVGGTRLPGGIWQCTRSGNIGSAT